MTERQATATVTGLPVPETERYVTRAEMAWPPKRRRPA